MAVTLAAPIHEIELAPGSAIRLKEISWQAYLALLQTLGEDRGARIAYSDRVLEIRMPGQLHESVNRVLAAIVLTLAEALDRDFNSLGSATLNRPDLVKGIEPDSCFYIRSVEAGQGMAGPTTLPPDLAIEVDIASSSEQKMEIYQAMGVPELWLYRDGRLVILCLQVAGGYTEVERSGAFPEVSAAQLNEWVGLRKTGTDLTVVKAVRRSLAP
ncbi:Uma2 family endonuclease [Leptolyngbya sp. BC1307]|uniref:Uma2 family endonuclease n=1 Tax=Leptolyngbya sp. BC1307 TaxID=2029589 RepID=UPI000EFA91B2|nr:Uma2 family endonuclease [Leptolyngbya sp. BC1307]